MTLSNVNPTTLLILLENSLINKIVTIKNRTFKVKKISIGYDYDDSFIIFTSDSNKEYTASLNDSFFISE